MVGHRTPKGAGIKGTIADGGATVCRAICQSRACKIVCGAASSLEAPEKEPREESHEEMVKRRNGEDKKECCSICCFFIYLTIFTVVLLLEQSASSARIAEHIRNKVESGGPVELEDISTVPTFYDYIERAFIPALYENVTDTRIARAVSPNFHPIDATNRIVGCIRMRQVRVQPVEACQVSPLFEMYNVNCYPKVTAESESNAAFGQDGKFTYGADDTGNDYTGQLGEYSKDGYIVYLSTNRTKAEATIRGLKTDGFLTDATRAVFLDFTVWSSNVGAYGVVTVAVEFGPAGGVKKSVDVLVVNEVSLQPGGLGWDSDWAAFLMVLVVIIFVIWYMVEEAMELKEKRFGYFADGWNVLDWINMVLLLVAFVFRIMVFAQADSENFGVNELTMRDGFANMRPLAEKVELVRLLHAFNAVLLWMKCVKYFRHIPLLKVLIRTVWKAFALFVPFLCMFMVAFIGFTMAYNIGFGDQIAEFSTFSQSAVFLGRSFVLDIKLMPAYDVTPKFGAGMILIFYVTIVLVGSSVFFAIVADSMYRAKYEKQPTRDEDEDLLEPFAWFKSALETVALRAGGFAFFQVMKVSPKLQKLVVKTFNVQAVHKNGRVVLERVPQGQLEDDDPGVDTLGTTGLPLAGLLDGRQGAIGDNDSVSSYTEDDGPTRPTRKELMRAIEHMSGRVLSEVSIVGIEIRSELHDVCERVAQMQMAVEELLQRADKVVAEQTPWVR